jgi:hypothetical protein
MFMVAETRKRKAASIEHRRNKPLSYSDSKQALPSTNYKREPCISARRALLL